MKSAKQLNPYATSILNLPFNIQLSVLFLVLTSFSFAEEANGLQVEQKSMKLREQIHTAEVEIEIHTAVSLASTNELMELRDGQQHIRKISLWVDGQFRRFEHAMPGVSNIDKDGVPQVSADNLTKVILITTPTERIFQDATIIPGRAPVAVAVSRPNPATDLEPLIFDVRWMGMIPMPFGLLHGKSVERFFGFEERAVSVLSSEDRDNIQTIKSAYERKDGLKFAAWMAPEMDYSVVRAEMVRVQKDGSVRIQEVNSQIEMFNDSTWFPRQVEYRCYSSDKLIAHERWLVKQARFNHEIDMRLFTLEGLALHDQTPVTGVLNENDIPEVKMWDGEKLADLQANIKNHEPKKLSLFKRFKWVVVANLVLLGVVLRFAYFYCKKANFGQT